MSAPFVWIFVCFAAGIWGSRFYYFDAVLLFPVIAIALLSARYAGFRLALASSLLLILLLGTALSQQGLTEYNGNDLRSLVRFREREVVSIEGRLLRTPEISREYFVLQVEVDLLSGIPCKGVARLTVTGDLEQPLVTGDRIQSFARLRLPRNFRTPGAFDYEQYLRGQNIHVMGSIKSSKLIHKIQQGKGVKSYFSTVRMSWIRRTILNYSPAEAGVLRALWLDDRGGLSQGQERILTDAGIFHVIAISGFHISVLLVILFLLLKHFVSFRIAIVTASLCLLFYFVLLEGRSSVTRAFLSFLVLAFAIWRYEHIRVANWICLSAWIQLLLNPQELYDAGFQLTYLSTATILFLVLPVCRIFRRLAKVYRYCLGFIVTGVVVQIVLIPYQLYVFHRVPVNTFLANIIAVPLSSVLIASSILLMPLPVLAKFLSIPVRQSIQILMDSAGLFAEHGVRIVPTPSLFLVFGFYSFLAFAVVAARLRWRAFFIALSLVFLTVTLIPKEREGAAHFQAHFLDVGQGDAILLEYPDGTFDLVDGGGFFNLEALDTGQAILLPYLCRMGVTALNRVFLTHAHADHMNGLISLMRYFPVKELYVTRQPVGTFGYQHFLRSINRGASAISRGTSFQQAGVRLEVLSPDDSNKRNRVANDDSLVLLIHYRGRRILLTGDVEMNAEEVLSRRFSQPIDYLKVPHHGSKTSSSPNFLRALKPRAAFISVGTNNWFGHPDPTVLDRYKENHVMVFRTDWHGTIKLRITGQGDEVITW